MAASRPLVSTLPASISNSRMRSLSACHIAKSMPARRHAAGAGSPASNASSKRFHTSGVIGDGVLALISPPPPRARQPAHEALLPLTPHPDREAAQAVVAVPPATTAHLDHSTPTGAARE